MASQNQSRGILIDVRQQEAFSVGGDSKKADVAAVTCMQQISNNLRTLFAGGNHRLVAGQEPWNITLTKGPGLHSRQSIDSNQLQISAGTGRLESTAARQGWVPRQVACGQFSFGSASCNRGYIHVHRTYHTHTISLRSVLLSFIMWGTAF